MKYYVRIEGVNLHGYTHDTNNLSTIRGGSLLLLRCADLVHNELPHLNPVRMDASIGLFAFDAEDDLEAAAVRQNVATILRNHSALRYATFAVDIESDHYDFSHTSEVLLARNRWRQFQQPTVVLPERNSLDNVFACELDRVRPGMEELKIAGKAHRVSRSVAKRHEYGKEQKQEFYRSEVAAIRQNGFDAQFVNDLETLTAGADRGNLHHKMAVIYLDGNGFGNIRHTVCRSEDEHRRFDEKLKTYRAQALDSLLTRMANDRGYRTEAGLFRLETLLWGGDEILWVVPAWKGWSVLESFYAHSSSWTFEGNALTHAGGLVFCGHKAPIHRIVDLCRSLAEAAKEASRQKSLFQYVVLESFDHIGRDLVSFRRARYPGVYKTSLSGDEMGGMAESIRQFTRDFSRSNLYAAVHAAIQDAGDNGRLHEERFNERLSRLLPVEAFNSIATMLARDYFGSLPGVWLHLAELWDYIPEEGEL